MSANNPVLFNIDLDDFDQQVIQASFDQPMLVDFWTDWCSPCLVIAPVLKQVIEDFDGQVKLAKLEVDEGENMKLAGRYAVRGFPTIILFRDGEEQERFSGAKSAGFIDQFISRHL